MDTIKQATEALNDATHYYHIMGDEVSRVYMEYCEAALLSAKQAS